MQNGIIRCGLIAAISLFALVMSAVPSLATDHVVIVLDDSGSMNDRMKPSRVKRIDAAKQALTKVIGQFSNDTNVGVLLLNGAKSKKHWLVPLGPIKVRDAIDSVGQIRADGGTPLGESMRLAVDELLAARAKAIYGTYRLIVVTDGEANDQRLLESYLPDILSRGIIVDAIGVDMRQDHSLATRVHSYRRADDEQSLLNAMESILAENPSANANDADFELMAALDEVDAAQILKALSTVDNSAISGAEKRRNASDNPSPANSSPAVSTAPSTNLPPNASASGNTNATNAGDGILEQVIGTVCTCLLPLIVALLVFVGIFAGRSRRRR